MKKYCTIIFCLLFYTLQAQNYYYNGDKKIEIFESKNSFISYDKPSEKFIKQFNEVKKFSNKSFTLFENGNNNITKRNLSDEKLLQTIPALLLDTNSDFKMFLTKTIRVKLKANNSKVDITNFINDKDIVSIVEKYGVLRIKINDIHKVLEIANKIYESGVSVYSIPDFYIAKKVNQVNDPIFPLQYQMHNTGQTIDGVIGVNNIDVNALEAWNINLGNSITVAVIDQGLEAHEDLGNRLIGGHTPVNNGNGEPVLNGDTHGMKCAGILAASDDNLGVHGVAPNSNLFSVNIFAGGETLGNIADGITWAANNGADIISNSWSFSNVPCGYTNVVIDNAILDAVTTGRNQKGCVIVFASGNDTSFQGGCVDYPATNPNVISVGAIDNKGNLYGYSRRGTELDLVAPSGLDLVFPGETKIGVRTLDRMGSSGDFLGNYSDDFDGTSAACPVVAGVAALVLSAKPSLTQLEVRNILTTTATDMGTSGFDNNFGFGRVNAYAALQAVLPNYNITGPAQICNNSSASFTLNNASNQATITWSASPAGGFNLTPNGLTVSVMANNNFSGIATLTADIIDGNITYSLSKEVQIGATRPIKLDRRGDEVAVFDFCTLQWEPITFSIPPGTLEWEWNIGYGNFSLQTNGNLNYVSVFSNQPTSGVLEVRLRDACGWSAYTLLVLNFTDCGGNFRFNTFPNPTNSVINIESKDENNENENSYININNSKATLYDQYGNVIKTISPAIGKFDVSNLRKGHYIIRIIFEDRIETHKIIVE